MPRFLTCAGHGIMILGSTVLLVVASRTWRLVFDDLAPCRPVQGAWGYAAGPCIDACLGGQRSRHARGHHSRATSPPNKAQPGQSKRWDSKRTGLSTSILTNVAGCPAGSSRAAFGETIAALYQVSLVSG